MLATQTEVSDGTLNIINVGIEFFEQADIAVYLDQSETPLVLGVDYNWTSATTIQFLPTVGVPGGLVPNGVTVTLRRHTEQASMYNVYDGGAPFSRLSLDENFEQLLFLAQEYSDTLAALDDVSHASIRVPVIESVNVLPAAATRAGKLLSFDGAGQPVVVAAASGSATQLELELADTVNPLLGAAKIGRLGGGNVADLFERTPISGSTLIPYGAGVATVGSELALHWATMQALNQNYINVALFFPSSDPLTWSTPGAINTALNAAQASATRPCTLVMPAGFFTMTSTFMVRTDLPVRLVGAGMYSTTLGCTVAMTGLPMINSQHAVVVDNHHFFGFTLLGSGFAAIGYQCEHFTHGSMVDVMVQGTTVVGIRLNDGYSNYFQNVKIFSNLGNGIDFTGSNVNSNVFNAVIIYANEGMGMFLANGLGNTLLNCGIEGNKQGGLMMWDCDGTQICGGYYERNCATGFVFSIANGNPENMNVKADIFLLGGGKVIGLSGTGMRGVDISGVLFAPFGTGNFPTAGLKQDCHIFLGHTSGLNVNSTTCLDTAHVDAMYGVYNNNTKSKVQKFSTSQNTIDTFKYMGAGNNTFAFGSGHEFEDRFATYPFNYASPTRTDYAIVSGATGALADGTLKYGNTLSWTVSLGDRVYAATLDASTRPEIRGKMCWFGMAYRVTDANTGLRVSCNGYSSSDSSGVEVATPSGVWKFLSVTFPVDIAATNLFLSFSRIGAGTNPIVVAAPSFGILGTGAHSMNLRR